MLEIEIRMKNIGKTKQILFLGIASAILSHLNFVTSFSHLPFLPNAGQHQMQKRKCSGVESRSVLHLSTHTEQEVKSISIAVTREDGKNTKILQAIQSHTRLSSHSVPCRLTEIPCIAHAEGPDAGDTFTSALLSSPSEFDYIAITSPEAAQVFASTWKQTTISNENLPKICAVGKATQEALNSNGLSVSFVPSKATAATLVKELPPIEDKNGGKEISTTTVLYPASAKAKPTLQKGLEARTDAKFQVTRLNTYDTIPASWTEEQLKLAQIHTQIVCFASPSAVESWVEKVNQGSINASECMLVACIGETSAQACREMGWKEQDIFYPEKPGVDGWAESVMNAADRIQTESFSTKK